MDENNENVGLDQNEPMSFDEQKKMEEARNDANNANAVRVAAKTVVNYYTAGKGGKVVDLASKTKLGQNVLNTGGKIVSKVNKHNPMGNITQSVINKANESGALDLADNLVNDKGLSKGKKEEAGLNKKQENNVSDIKKDNNSEKTKKSNLSVSDAIGLYKLIKNYKMVLIFSGIGLGILAFVFIFLLIFGPNSGAMLDLTSGSSPDSSSGGSSSSGSSYTSSEIEEGLVYVGDSRVERMKNIISSNNITYVTSSNADYNWFASTGSSSLSSLLNEGSNVKFVVIALGLYDLNNAQNYINIFNNLQATYSDVEFLFLSVNPINSERITDNRFTSLNSSEIINFNSTISAALSDTFINTYDHIVSNFTAPDGVHYGAETYIVIHDYVIDYIKNNFVKGHSLYLCGGNFVNYYQYNYLESYGYGTTIASSGCGPTAMAMVLTYILERQITPVETANWSLANGHRVQGAGTSWAFFPAISNHYGIKGEQISFSQDAIISSLNECKLVIVSMSCCTFTTGGHFIVLTGVSDDGKIAVADPNSEARSLQLWDPSIFISEGRAAWAFSI